MLSLIIKAIKSLLFTLYLFINIKTNNFKIKP